VFREESRVGVLITDPLLLVADLLVILAVPLTMAGIQFLAPAALLELLTYSSGDPSLHGLFGHWAVHYSALLLLENLAGYLVVALLGYGLAWSMSVRRWFRLSLLAILLVVPALSAIASTWAFGAVAPELVYDSRGASAVVAAVLGLCYALALGAIRRTYDLRAAISVGGAMLVVVLTGLLVRIGSPSSAVTVLLPGAVGAVLVLDVAERYVRTDVQIRPFALAYAGTVTLAVTLVMGGYFLALFPADPFAGSTVTNVYSHATGFGLGTVIGIWGARYWTTVRWVHDSRH
jgi:hypothetical protein